jgi:hypothetical protein
MDATTTQVAIIDEALLPRVQEKVARANRHAAKVGNDAQGYTLSYVPADPRPIMADDPFNPGCQRVVGHVAQVEVTVVGEAPRYAGWTFAARLTWDGDEPVIRKVEGLEVDTTPARAQLTPRGCDHCHTSRDRNDTYLLVSDSGDFKQVGSNCLVEFLGVQVNLSYIGWNPYEGCDPTNTYVPERLLSLGILELAIAATRVWGWVSAGQANNDWGKISTKSRIRDVLWGSAQIKREYQEMIAAAHRPEDATLAAEVLEWVRNNGESNEYLDNLRVALRSDTFRLDNLGLVVSAPAAYRRAQERQEEREAARQAKAASNWIGEPKERLRDLRLTVTGLRYLESDWGVTTLVMFTDEQGNQVKWFASSLPVEIENEGVTVVLDGTVKEHDTFRDTKSTVLTRCKVKEVVAQ